MAVVYTHNGTAQTPHVFVVAVATGLTVGEFNVAPAVDVKNPQAVQLDWTTGDLYLADIGDPQKNRTDLALWRVSPEPGPGSHGTLPGVRLGVSYPFAPVDAQAFAIHPVTGVSYIITREAQGGRLLRLPKPLTGNNAATNLNKTMPANVTDATFTLDGRLLLIRTSDSANTIVFDGTSFTARGVITTSQAAAPLGGSITMEPSDKCFLILGDQQFSSLFRVCLPAQFLPAPPAVTFVSGTRQVNTSQTYRVSNFAPNSTVTVTIKRPNGTTFQTVELTTNAAGTAQASFTPNTSGTWSITASQTVNGVNYLASLNVVITATSSCDPSDRPKDVLASIAQRRWKLTLPTPLNCGSSGAQEIQASQLAAGYEITPYFFTVCPDNAVVFRAPTNGTRTTTNTDFPRSELREMTANGTDQAAWTLGSGQHILDVTQAVTQLPQRSSVCRVVTAQIHDNSDDVCVISCDASSSSQTTGLKLYASLGNNHTYRLIDGNYTRGAYFRVVMATTASGVAIFYAKNPAAALGPAKFVVPTGQRSGCYFKAGAYTQASSCEGGDKHGTGYGEVRVKKLAITHA